MGDRGNIKVHNHNSNIYFYTHWSGSNLPKILKDALSRSRSRWNDSPYLNRIIFCEMIKHDTDPLNSITGFGIDTEECDSGKLIHVNTDAQTISIREGTWSFEEFINLSENTIVAL